MTNWFVNHFWQWYPWVSGWYWWNHPYHPGPVHCGWGRNAPRKTAQALLRLPTFCCKELLNKLPTYVLYSLRGCHLRPFGVAQWRPWLTLISCMIRVIDMHIQNRSCTFIFAGSHTKIDLLIPKQKYLAILNTYIHVYTYNMYILQLYRISNFTITELWQYIISHKTS